MAGCVSQINGTLEVSGTNTTIEIVEQSPVIVTTTSESYLEVCQSATTVEIEDNTPTVEIHQEPDVNVEVHAPIFAPKGDSAYQVAVNNGFKGTVDEWLYSLKANISYEDFRIPLIGKFNEIFVPDSKYISAFVVDPAGDEVSVCISYLEDRILIDSLVPLDGHALLLKG